MTGIGLFHTGYVTLLVCSESLVNSICEQSGFRHHSDAAPELDELLGHVNAIPIGTFKHPPELLKVL